MGIGAAILFCVTVVIVVLVQLIAPLFGHQAGAPSDAVLGSMLVWAAVALGFLPAALLVRHRE